MRSPRTNAQRSRRRVRAATPADQKRAPKRILDALIGLRVSSQQRQAMEWKAKNLGFESAQDWIRAHMGPEIEAAIREMKDTQELAAAS